MKKFLPLFLPLLVILPAYISCGSGDDPASPDDPRSFTISYGYLFLNKDKSFDLSVKDYPAGATLEWTSSNESIVSVKDGKVTAHKKEGEALVSVTVKGSSLYNAQCIVRVVPEDWLTIGCGAIHMVDVEGGTFMMGEDKRQRENPDPQMQANIVHEVTLSSYRMSDSEITLGLWESVMNPDTPKNAFIGENAYYPVTNKTYKEITAFINQLNVLTGRNFRLPTEAQWEYAARGGNATNDYLYSGSDLLFQVGVYYDNADLTDFYRINLLYPNELGIYDLSGGVNELCSDYYGEYPSVSVTDPIGPKEGTSRVVRGGSYISSAEECTVFHRTYMPEDQGAQTLGFRLVE